MTKQTQNTGPCSCGGCGESFRRLSYFDRHRTGPYRLTSARLLAGQEVPATTLPALTERRCLTSTAMLGLHWNKDPSGKWYKPGQSYGKAMRLGAVVQQK